MNRVRGEIKLIDKRFRGILELCKLPLANAPRLVKHKHHIDVPSAREQRGGCALQLDFPPDIVKCSSREKADRLVAITSLLYHFQLVRCSARQGTRGNISNRALQALVVIKPRILAFP